MEKKGEKVTMIIEEDTGDVGGSETDSNYSISDSENSSDDEQCISKVKPAVKPTK